jgi:5-methyltetrahydrofolate--homocysteine methyltransferase
MAQLADPHGRSWRRIEIDSRSLGQLRGVHFAWGFGALPNVEEHRKVFQLLPAERELGMSLTSAGQLIPEQSTATLIVHHSAVRYFNV